MSRASALQVANYNTEATFGEVTASFGTRLALVDKVTINGVMQATVEPNRITGYRNQITPAINGVKGGSFQTKMWLTGHGSTCAGAITLNDLETLLGIVLGNAVAASANGTTAAAGGTTTALNVVAANGFLAGGLCRVGAANDGRGGGQFYKLSGHAGSVITLLTALPLAANAADVVYAPVLIYPNELPASTFVITGTRWLVQTANLQLEAHGCYPKSFTIEGLNTGSIPFVTITWGVSWWQFSTAANPLNATMQSFAAAPVARGSVFLNQVGSSARLTRAIRDFKLTYNLGITELPGPGGVDQYQMYVGCTRTRDTMQVEFVEDSENATLTPDLATKWDNNATWQMLYTLSIADGSALALNFNYLVPTGNRPVQEDVNNLNRIRFQMKGGTGNTITTDLTAAAFILASA